MSANESCPDHRKSTRFPIPYPNLILSVSLTNNVATALITLSRFSKPSTRGTRKVSNNLNEMVSVDSGSWWWLVVVTDRPTDVRLFLSFT